MWLYPPSWQSFRSLAIPIECAVVAIPTECAVVAIPTEWAVVAIPIEWAVVAIPIELAVFPLCGYTHRVGSLSALLLYP